MKRTEDIVDYDLQEILDIAVMNSSYCRNILIRVIKQAQIDAIKETCEECAESADFEYDDDGYSRINKKSILSVSDILIKELE